MPHGAQGPLQSQRSGNARGAWCLGKDTPMCALCSGWCVPCAIQGQLTDPAEHRIRFHCHCHISTWGYLVSHTCGAVELLGLRKATPYLEKTGQHRAMLYIWGPGTGLRLPSPREILLCTACRGLPGVGFTGTGHSNIWPAVEL